MSDQTIRDLENLALVIDEFGNGPLSMHRTCRSWAKQIREAIQESGAAALRVQSDEWQPIDTAPTDMTKVLLWQPTGNLNRIVGHKVGFSWSSIPGGYGVHPTLWQPLPDPPAALRVGRRAEPEEKEDDQARSDHPSPIAPLPHAPVTEAVSDDGPKCPRCGSIEIRRIQELFGAGWRDYCDACQHIFTRPTPVWSTIEPDMAGTEPRLTEEK